MSDNEFEFTNTRPTRTGQTRQTANEQTPVRRVQEAQAIPEDNLNHIIQQQKSLVAEYRNEEQVPIRISPSYAKYFGNTMTVSINGICVTVTCDGRTQTIPKTFATEVLRRMQGVDEQERRLNAMGNISKNFDGTRPGDLTFF